MKNDCGKFRNLFVAVLVAICFCHGCASWRTTADREPEPPAEPAAEASALEDRQMGPPPAMPPEELPNYIHTVKWNGESLSIIAAWYTGELKNWEAVAAANPEIDPNLIHIGNKIRIPEHMLKTREPMPMDFVARFVPRAKEKKLPESESPPAAGVIVESGVEQPEDEALDRPPADEGPGAEKPAREPQQQAREEEEPMLFGPRSSPKP